MIHATATLLVLAIPQGGDGPSLESTLPVAAIDDYRSRLTATLKAEIALRRQTGYHTVQPGSERYLLDRFPTARTGHALAQIGDLVAIFDRSLPTRGRRIGPKGRKLKNRGRLYGPRSHRATHPYPLVLRLTKNKRRPRTIEEIAWTSIATDRAALVAVQPLNQKALEPFDSEHWVIALQRDVNDPLEHPLAALREVLDLVPIDPRRVLLECEPGTTTIGLHLATTMPSRFAGVILHEPAKLVVGFQLHSLAATPVLLVTDPLSALAAARIAEALKDLGGRPTTLEKADERTTRRMAEWIHKRERPLFPRRIELVANTSAVAIYSHWVTALPSPEWRGFGRDEPPRLVATADYATSTINIQVRGFPHVDLRLNDFLVDIDKVRIVVNDAEPTSLRSGRNSSMMIDTVLSSQDTSQVYPARHSVNVPLRGPGSFPNFTVDRLGAGPIARTADGKHDTGPAGRSRSTPPAAARIPPPPDPIPREHEPPEQENTDPIPQGRLAPMDPPADDDLTGEGRIDPVPTESTSGGGFFPFRFELPDLSAWLALVLFGVLGFAWYRSRTST